MIANLFKAIGGVISLIVGILVVVVLMYISYILAIGAVIIFLIYVSFGTLEVFRTSK